MARYDRIAALDPPDRSRAFGGWPILRDLEKDDRNPDLARRARLRFLAFRIVQRLIDQGIENVPVHSIERQIECVREELGALPARDPERLQLAEFLNRIRSLTPRALATAVLDLGEAAEAAEQDHAAEEFYHAALDLARIYQLRAPSLERETSRTQR